MSLNQSLKKTLTAAALLGSLFAASSVFAHAHLKSQIPAANSTVTDPGELRLVFSEGIETTFSTVKISRDGEDVPVKNLATKSSDKKTLIVTPEVALEPGTYKVEWKVTSVDTHKSAGNYSFKIGQ